MKKILIYSLLVILVYTFSGCRKTYAVYNVTQPIESFSPTNAQMQSAILDAANKTGWQVMKKNDSKFVLKYQQPKYEATLSIKYNTSSYDIDYIMSENLKYSEGTIHKTYNKKVKRLHNEIRANLLKIKKGQPLEKPKPISKKEKKQKSLEEKLLNLKSLHEKGLIDDAEYSDKKEDLLKSL